MSNADTSMGRLLSFIKEIKSSQSRFEKSIGASKGYINNVKMIGSDKLASIIENYPQLNIYWLLSGKGDMIRKEGGEGGKDESCRDRVESDIFIFNMLKEMDNKIELLSRIIGEDEETPTNCDFTQKREED